MNSGPELGADIFQSACRLADCFLRRYPDELHLARLFLVERFHCERILLPCGKSVFPSEADRVRARILTCSAENAGAVGEREELLALLVVRIAKRDGAGGAGVCASPARGAPGKVDDGLSAESWWRARGLIRVGPGHYPGANGLSKDLEHLVLSVVA